MIVIWSILSFLTVLLPILFFKEYLLTKEKSFGLYVLCVFFAVFVLFYMIIPENHEDIVFSFIIWAVILFGATYRLIETNYVEKM